MNDPHAKFRAVYPSWPWVGLDTVFGSPTRNINLPPVLGDEDLKKLVDLGRAECQELLESDVDQFNTIISNTCRKGPDPSGNKHQITGTRDRHFSRTWKHQDTTPGLDNRGFVQYGRDGRTYTVDGRSVDRRFDHILSVLESLPVHRAQKFKYSRPHTISSITYPYGPNVRIEQVQNKKYVTRSPHGHEDEVALVRSYLLSNSI